MQWKHTVVVTGATLVGAWMAGTPQGPPALTSPAARSASAAPTTDPTPDIELEARRLQLRVGRRLAGEASQANRNPFRFRDTRPSAGIAARVGPEAPAPDESSPPVLPPPAPRAPAAVRLIGMATDDAAGTVTRTAVLSTAQGVALVGTGDAVAGYRVTAVEADAVELTDADGRTVRLTLTP